MPVQLVGCGIKVKIPDRPPTPPEIKSWSDRRVVNIEKAIRKKDRKLPGRVKGLIRYLRGLEINVSIGPGKKFKNTEEAIGAIDGIVYKLQEWFDKSLGRPQGDSDEDRAELQAIMDEAKEVLRNIKVRES